MKQFDWQFPLASCHQGLPLGNAVTGVLIWGEARQLNITLGRADAWDHRGGMAWSDQHNFTDIRDCLESNDQERLRALFRSDTQESPGQAERPSLIPVGRIEIDLGPGACLKEALLYADTGRCEITYVSGENTHKIDLILMMDQQVVMLQNRATQAAGDWQVRYRPAFAMVDQLRDISFVAPTAIDQDGMQGWFQPFPADDGVAVIGRQSNDGLMLANARSLAEAEHALASALPWHEACDQAAGWWANYWIDVPKIQTPDALVNELYYYGMYKFAGFSQPAGVAGGLQGPWIEDTALPPWSGDYHFNINVQMCYWPAFKSGKLEHLRPLFDMIFNWEPILRENARKFIGIDDGVMLPHAVDDRCVCMGGFWTGIIDHACTAWVAEMMWRYVDQSGDWALLKEKVLPFMTAAMRVFEEMLEFDGQWYHLPVSVSPEYNGSQMNAWGRDASFQLAAIHCLLDNIRSAHEQLQTALPEQFDHIKQHLPEFTTVGEGNQERIALWKDQDLDVSHRHHSHLAGICPFDTIDLANETNRPLIERSIDHWIARGMGMWSGWCMPWASMIHARLGNGDSARLLLSIWHDVFLNKGRGSVHDPVVPGLSLLGSNSKEERMQLDGGFGAVTAVQEMLVQNRRGVIHVFPAIPAEWASCSFGPMPAGGGVTVSAEKSAGSSYVITLTATRSTRCHIKLPWQDAVQEHGLQSGQSVTLRSPAS